ALASMIAGVWTLSHFIFVRPMKKVQQQYAKVQQQTQLV
ncbi:YeeE/YedE family protein, partial [Staphylococcus aureus]